MNGSSSSNMSEDDTKLMSEFDLSESSELPPTSITHSSIVLSIAILSIVVIIFLIVLCKLVRCLCFQQNPNNHDQTERISSVIQSDISTIHWYPQHHRSQIKHSLSCDHINDGNRYTCTTKDGFLSPPLPSYNRCHSNEVNSLDANITRSSIQINQQTMNEFLNIFFQIILYFGIIAIIAYFIYPLHNNIENYFKNNVVWITGASSGIGRALAKELIRLSPSTRLVLSARREDELHSLVAELPVNPDQCLVLPLDLETHEYGFQSKVDIVLDRFNQIDVLINNAGISQRSLIKETKYAVDTRLISINFLGTITLTKAVLSHFIQRQKGHFVVVTSVAGYAATSLRSSYAASKHALHAFFDALRLEHTKDHIDVTIVCPGFVKTNISINALEGSGQLHNKMDPKTEKGTDPTVCAYDILHGIAARKHEIYVGHLASIVIYLRRLCPQLLYRIFLRTEAS
ncbi:unnamed protein product [Rotaria sordida]|uniref:Ketoreductase domain-containing protein n=1 Tax=Rotaria sordida TaxID=392033 RepID=A0A813YB95_9BILA|nr:unnamed protein product [Rotaria sordida]